MNSDELQPYKPKATGQKLRTWHVFYFGAGVEVDHVAFAKATGVMHVDDLAVSTSQEPEKVWRRCRAAGHHTVRPSGFQ